MPAVPAPKNPALLTNENVVEELFPSDFKAKGMSRQQLDEIIKLARNSIKGHILKCFNEHEDREKLLKTLRSKLKEEEEKYVIEPNDEIDKAYQAFLTTLKDFHEEALAEEEENDYIDGLTPLLEAENKKRLNQQSPPAPLILSQKLFREELKNPAIKLDSEFWTYMGARNLLAKNIDTPENKEKYKAVLPIKNTAQGSSPPKMVIESRKPPGKKLAELVQSPQSKQPYISYLDGITQESIDLTIGVMAKEIRAKGGSPASQTLEVAGCPYDAEESAKAIMGILINGFKVSIGNDSTRETFKKDFAKRTKTSSEAAETFIKGLEDREDTAIKQLNDHYGHLLAPQKPKPTTLRPPL